MWKSYAIRATPITKSIVEFQRLLHVSSQFYSRLIRETLNAVLASVSCPASGRNIPWVSTGQSLPDYPIIGFCSINTSFIDWLERRRYECTIEQCSSIFKRTVLKLRFFAFMSSNNSSKLNYRKLTYDGLKIFGPIHLNS